MPDSLNAYASKIAEILKPDQVKIAAFVLVFGITSFIPDIMTVSSFKSSYYGFPFIFYQSGMVPSRTSGSTLFQPLMLLADIGIAYLISATGILGYRRWKQ